MLNKSRQEGQPVTAWPSHAVVCVEAKRELGECQGVLAHLGPPGFGLAWRMH